MNIGPFDMLFAMFYAFNFRPNRLQELVQDLSSSFGAIQNQLTTFIQFLEALDDPGGGRYR